MLIEQLLITQVLRPVPRAPVLLEDEQELSHGSNGTPQPWIEALEFGARRLRACGDAPDPAFYAGLRSE